jgi:hypothetical protein
MYVIIEIDDVGAEGPLNAEQSNKSPATCRSKPEGSCGGLY